MSVFWFLALAIIVASYVIEKALARLTLAIDSVKCTGTTDGLAIAQIAATLIAAEYKNPAYLERMAALEDALRGAERVWLRLPRGATSEAQKELKDADDAIKDYRAHISHHSVFLSGRAKFIALAQQIYSDVKHQ